MWVWCRARTAPPEMHTTAHPTTESAPESCMLPDPTDTDSGPINSPITSRRFRHPEHRPDGSVGGTRFFEPGMLHEPLHSGQPRHRGHLSYPSAIAGLPQSSHSRITRLISPVQDGGVQTSSVPAYRDSLPKEAADCAGIGTAADGAGPLAARRSRPAMIASRVVVIL